MTWWFTHKKCLKSKKSFCRCITQVLQWFFPNKVIFSCISLISQYKLHDKQCQFSPILYSLSCIWTLFIGYPSNIVAGWRVQLKRRQNTSKMAQSCCAIDCTNRFHKKANISFCSLFNFANKSHLEVRPSVKASVCLQAFVCVCVFRCWNKVHVSVRKPDF